MLELIIEHVYQFFILESLIFLVRREFPRCGGAAFYALDLCEVCLCLCLRTEQDSGAT